MTTIPNRHSHLLTDIEVLLHSFDRCHFQMFRDSLNSIVPDSKCSFIRTRLETLDKTGLCHVSTMTTAITNNDLVGFFWYSLQIIQTIKILSTYVWPFTLIMCVAVALQTPCHRSGEPILSILFILFRWIARAHEQVEFSKTLAYTCRSQ